MPKYRLDLFYDGTDFVGWQRQRNGASIQETLEEALGKILLHPVSCRGAGRTDAGVHASGQVVTFFSERTLPERALIHGTNSHLPPTIAVMAARIVPDEFDARFSSNGKLYRYKIWNSPVRSPHVFATHWHIRRELDVDAMHDAGQLFVGKHDFSAFRAADCERKTTVRWVRRLEVRKLIEQEHPIGHTVILEVEATAFLKQMVRILTGTLVEVGRGRMRKEQIQELLLRGNRSQAGPTAPAHGLCLCRVDYGPRLVDLGDSGESGESVESEESRGSATR